jgi:UDP-N-acetylmuramyl pentapeptide phosphotransferase/UDP-N-acetylglucosamine-1-phosphate transferase
MGGLVIVLSTVISYFLAKLFTDRSPSASSVLLLFLLVKGSRGVVLDRLVAALEAGR